MKYYYLKIWSVGSGSAKLVGQNTCGYTKFKAMINLFIKQNNTK